MLLVACGPGSRSGASAADAGADVVITGDATTCTIARGTVLDLQNDDHNCGAVCHDCTLCGGTCVAGHCTPDTLVADTSATAQLAVDATRIYWVDFGQDLPGSGRVLAMDKHGGMPQTLVDGETKTQGVAVDTSFVYWTNAQTASAPGSVKKQPLGGGNAITIDAMPSYNPAWIDADATGVYWYGSGMAGLYTESATDTPLAIAEPSAWGYAGAAGLAYYLHVDATGTLPEELRSSPHGGGAYSVLATTAARDWAFVAAGGDGIYATAQTTGEIVRVPFAGGAPVVVASDQSEPIWIVGDERAVYWSDFGPAAADGKLMKLVPGGQPEEVVAIRSPMQLAIDDSCVYVETITTESYPFRGQLVRVAR
ncbi:MAG: hypothetical protein ACM31C_25680 [Acidobacteriota bacterium]